MSVSFPNTVVHFSGTSIKHRRFEIYENFFSALAVQYANVSTSAFRPNGELRMFSPLVLMITAYLAMGHCKEGSMNVEIPLRHFRVGRKRLGRRFESTTSEDHRFRVRERPLGWSKET